MHGIHTKERYSYDLEIAILRYMNWGPCDLLDAPDEMVEVIVTKMNAENKWMAEKHKSDSTG